ncbi:MAG: leucine-rich repeat protein, partial [Christensenellales bacterium]
GVDGTIVIPNTVMATWYGAFYDNGHPTYVEDGAGLKTIKFSSDEIKNQRNNTLLIGNNSFYNSRMLETIELPKGVEKIPKYTFYYCTALRNINIPNTVSRIEPQAFYYCSAMDNIVFDESDPDNVISLDLRNDLNNATSASAGGIFYTCNALTTLTLPERTVELGRYSMSGTKLVTVNLPSTLQRIDYSAFKDVVTLKQVNFPAQMESTGFIIEDSVFYGCSALTTVNLPEGLEGLGYYAFYNCKALKNITIPSTVNDMGRYYFSATSTTYGSVFYGCSALEKAEFAYTVVDGVKVTNAVLTKIGSSTFRNCSSLTEFYVPASVEIIDTYAFAGCTKLASITFEKGSIEGGSKLETIGNYAFQSTALTEFIFPESSVDVMELGSNIFDKCTTLSKVYLSRNISDIGAAFKGCSNITDLTVSPKNVNFKVYQSTDGKKYPLLVDPDGTSIKFVYGDIVGEFAIPEGIESIADSAFKDQTLITKITLPASLITIGQYAFSYCSALEEVVVPYDSAMETIGGYSFEYTTSLKHIDIPGDENGNMKVRLETYCFRYSGIESITFRGDIAYVGNYIFQYCTNLTTVNNWVPNMPFIPNYFFYGCSSLENFTIPSFVTSIKTYSLYKTGIKKLVIPSGIKEIGNYAFASNVNLEEVTFEENTELVEGGFGTYVFSSCTALKTVDLSPLKELNWLNTNTFRGCTALEEVTLPEKLANLNYTAPSKETATTTASTAYTFYGCTSLKKVNNLNDNITIFGTYLFYNCSSLEEIVLPSELRIIGSYCFTGCTSLTNVDFDHIVNGAIDPEGQPDADGNPARIAGTGGKLENIMTYAFGASSASTGTPAIEKMVIPSTVKTIGASAFRYNESLKEVEFEYNTLLTTFSGSYAFANCINLEKVNLNNLPNIVYLNTYAFYYCSSLKTIAVDSEGNTTNRFPDKLVALGTASGSAAISSYSYAFKGCSSLEFVDLNKVTQIGGDTFRDCTALKSVNNLGNATILGAYCFRNTALEEVTFGSKVTGYGYGIFADCIGLKKATIEKGTLTYVGYNSTSTTLTTFTTSSTIYGPFGGCTALEEVTLPDNLINLTPHTFANCTSLKAINFAALSKVVNICSYAFYNTSLEEADLSALSALTVIGSYSFAQVETLRRVTFPTRSSLTTIEIGAFSNDGNVTSISLPASVTTIKKEAFRNCGLTEFTVPAGLTTIGESVFAGNKITTYKSNNSNYRIGSNGELIQIVADGDDLVVGISAAFSGVYVFEKGTAPGPYCFAGVTGLTGVQFPEGITELPEYSFAGYTGKITLPETITSIGAYAFYEAELTDFVIPASVTSVGYRAFAYATIDKLVIPSTVEKVGQYLCYYANIREYEYNVPAAIWISSTGAALATNGAAGDSSMLSYVKGLEKITIGEGVQYVGTYFIWNASECNATVYFPDGMDMTQARLIYGTKGCKFDIRLPSDMTAFGQYAFYSSNTTEPEEGWTEYKMTIPDGVETLNGYLFGGCIINDVVFPKTIKTIEQYALNYCMRETEFVIPKTVETYVGQSIRYGTFAKVVFEEGMEEIPASSTYGKFYYSTIGELTLPSTLKTIGNYFLYYSKGPAKLVLPEGLKTVGTYAFYYNKNIYELYLPTTVEFVDGNTAFSGWTEEQTIYSTLDRTATMAVWGASINATTFKGNVVYDYVPTPEQTENSVGIAINGEVAFVENKQD